MAHKELISVEMASGNPNLTPAIKFGNLVFVSGQTGTHPVSGKLGEGIREQTQFTIERINMVLKEAGTNLNNVLSVTTYLTRIEDFAAFNEEYSNYFREAKPSRTTVQAALAKPELVVEITVTACIPE